MRPYYEDESCAIYHGDAAEVLPALDLSDVSVVVTDPPYAETTLGWDRWPPGWPGLLAELLPEPCSLWCFGSFRMFLRERDEFAAWTLAQEVVWEKHNGSSAQADRFRRVHELAVHYYRGAWEDQHRDVPRVQVLGDSGRRITREAPTPHIGHGTAGTRYTYDGSRLQRSVIPVQSEHGRALHPTQKPVGIVVPLVSYSCAPGGLVLDPFAGSGTTLRAAKDLGRRAIGVEIHEQYCEAAASRLAQEVLAL